MLLGVVVQSLKLVQLLSQKLPTFLSNTVGAVHAHHKWFTKSYELYPSHDAQLGVSEPFADHCQMDATTPNILGPALLGVVASICK